MESKMSKLKVFLHNFYKMTKSSIFPLIFMKVFFQSIWESLMRNKKDELFDSGGTLWVSNSIKYGISNIGVWNCCFDGVCGAHLILVIAPLLSGLKGSHCWLILNGFAFILYFFQTIVTDVFSKALIKPDIIPPFHSY